MTKTRVGFYVEVELDTTDPSARFIIEALLDWPGSWTPAEPPTEFEGRFGQNNELFKGRIRRTEELMRKKIEDE